MLDLWLEHIGVVCGTVGVLMMGDYALTIWEQHSFRRRMAMHVEIESYEQNPFLAADVAGSRVISVRHTAGVLATLTALIVLSASGRNAALYFEILCGALFLTLVEVNLRHLANIAGLKWTARKPHELEGRVYIARGFGPRQLLFHYVARSLLWFIVYMLVPRCFFLGGVFGNLGAVLRSAITLRRSQRSRCP